MIVYIPIYGGVMKTATRKKPAEIAREKAELPFHGCLEGKESNIEPIIKHFPKWNIKEADRYRY